MCSLKRKKNNVIKIQDFSNFNNILNDRFKMNKIINKFLLTGDKFMPELHLKHPGFTYSVYGPFIKHCEGFQKFR